MSRIGKLPIEIPSGVEVKLENGKITVKGPKGELTTQMSPLLNYKMEGGKVSIERIDDSREANAQHGLRRTLLANCIHGVTKGFEKALEVNGVGYRVAVKGHTIEMSLGFSHPVLVELPPDLSAKVDGQVLTIIGIDKEKVGQMAASIRSLRKPEPYKGKGIKYVTETIRRKAGKSGAKAK